MATDPVDETVLEPGGWPAWFWTDVAGQLPEDFEIPEDLPLDDPQSLDFAIGPAALEWLRESSRGTGTPKLDSPSPAESGEGAGG